MATRKTTTKKPSKVSPRKKEGETIKSSGSNLATLTSRFNLDINKLRFSRLVKPQKSLYIILGLVGLAVVLFLISKYMVVAWVDNKPITRFEYYSSLEKKYGKDVREQLIVEKLINDEAQKRG